MRTFSFISSFAILASSVVGCAYGAGEADDFGEDVAVETQPLEHSLRCSTIEAKRAQNSFLGNALTGCRNHNETGSSIVYQGGTIWRTVNDFGDAPQIVQGLILSKYNLLGAQSSVIGYPTSDESTPLFGGGRFNSFKSGLILWKSGANEAFETHGDIRGLFQALGSEWGTMGFPTSDEKPISNPSRLKNDFEVGKIYWTSTRRAWPSMIMPLSGSKLANMPNHPQFESATITRLTGNDANISVTVKGFTPGRTATLRLTHPTRGIEWQSFPKTVGTDGRVTIGNEPGLVIRANQLWKLGSGFATLWVAQDDGAAHAVRAQSTLAGTFVPTSIPL